MHFFLQTFIIVSQDKVEVQLWVLYRHGICHGCTGIIRAKFLFTGVKFYCELTHLDINFVPVVLLIYVVILLLVHYK